MQPEWEIWLDNQLSSHFAKMMRAELGLTVKSAYVLRSKNLEDKEIFMRAKHKGNIIIITKDADFPALVAQYGSPSEIIKLNTGNLPTKLLWNKFGSSFKPAIKLLQKTKADIIFIE